jgi:hypothetical protein
MKIGMGLFRIGHYLVWVFGHSWTKNAILVEYFYLSTYRGPDRICFWRIDSKFYKESSSSPPCPSNGLVLASAVNILLPTVSNWILTLQEAEWSGGWTPNIKWRKSPPNLTCWNYPVSFRDNKYSMSRYEDWRKCPRVTALQLNSNYTY